MPSRIENTLNEDRIRGPRGGSRPGRGQRHHLEDETDRQLERYFGAGRSRRRDGLRRAETYRRRAEQLFTLVLDAELDPEAAELDVVRVESNAAGTLLTLVAAGSEVDDDLAQRLGPELRRELMRHLPRRRVPDVRVRIVEARGEEDR